MITSKIINDIKIAIVIPAHNEASTIMDCLTSVQLAIEQLPSTIIAYPLVVLDSCTDETLSLIKNAQVEYKIEYLTCDYRCVGRVRDLGFVMLLPTVRIGLPVPMQIQWYLQIGSRSKWLIFSSSRPI